MNVSGDKIAYMTDCLLAGNKMRHCAFIFTLLIVPMTLMKGLGGAIDMTIIVLMMGFMLRNIDAVFAKIFKGTANSPAAVVPFVLPIAMTVGFGAIFDFFIVVSTIANGYFSIWLAVLVLTLATRIVVCRITFPLARMMIDPNYVPQGLAARISTVGQDGLLIRQPAAPSDPEAGQQMTTSSSFRPFSGAAFTTSS